MGEWRRDNRPYFSPARVDARLEKTTITPTILPTILKGGAVAIRSTVPESIPSGMGKLSDLNSVRFFQFGAAMSLSSFTRWA